MTIEIINHPFAKVVGLKITSKIEAQDIEQITQIIEEKLKSESKLSIYAEVEDWSGISVKAFIKDLQFSLKHIKDFEKEVIVSDSKWLKKLAEIYNSLFSSIEVQHFNFADQDKAWEYVGQ